MDEKTMVSDTLTGINGELKMFGDMIPQTENPAQATAEEIAHVKALFTEGVL